MTVPLIHLPQLAKEQEKENGRFRRFLKFQCRVDDAEVDRRVADITQRVWAQIDCTTCANCCKTVHPTLSESDVERLARRLYMDRQTFIAQFLEAEEEAHEKAWRTRTTPCPFLQDNRCSVYEDRPEDCRGYPYLYEPEFSFRTIAMIERTATCPIVFEVMEELKDSLGFRPRAGR